MGLKSVLSHFLWSQIYSNFCWFVPTSAMCMPSWTCDAMKQRKQPQINPTDRACSTKTKNKSPTSFARAPQVAGPRAVAHIAVPAFSAHAVVLTGVAQTLFGRLLGARGLDPSCLLDLGETADVLTLPINEQVPDAAHIAVVEQCRPHLGGEHQPQLVLRQTSKVKVVIQVQDLTFSRGSVSSA